MSEINQTIPSFVNGVSRQAVESRHATQVEDMNNCTVSFVDGTRRRNPLVHLGALTALNGQDPYLYSYERGDGLEAYIVAILSGAWYVYDDTGSLVDSGTNSYLTLEDGALPRESFGATTIGDTTFIVNKTKIVTEGSTYTHGTVDTDYHKMYAYYWVKRSYIAYGGEDNQQASTYQYKIQSNTGTSIRPTDTEADSTTGANAYGKNSLTIANTMAGDLSNATNSGSVLRQLKSNYGSWIVSDSWGNMASEGWWGYMSKIQDLPEDMGSYSGKDTLIKITGDEKNNFEGFWANYIDGVWKESIQAGLKDSINASTMPHTLERKSLTDFEFSAYSFDKRKVGDDFSNMMPSFVGYKIEDIFFYRNRLGFISRDSIILSEVGIYENFFRTTVTDIIATDPVDVTVDSNKVVTLKYAIPFKRNLLLFGTNAQYILSADNDLKPDTVSISQSTVYQINPKTQPTPIGPNTYFTVNKGTATQVREYYNVPDSVDNIAEDISAHVSTYIPNDCTDLEVSAKYDMIFLLSSNDANSIYVYNQSWEGDKKAQSAWHKWLLGSNVTIQAIRVMSDTLYVVYKDASNNTQLASISLAKEDYTSITYSDFGTTAYDSNITLSEWGFQTGGQAKVDDKQGRLQIRKIELQTRPSSQQKIKVTVGTQTHTTEGDKATVMGETKKTSIIIESKDSEGFCIDSTNMKGRFNSRSKTV